MNVTQVFAVIVGQDIEFHIFDVDTSLTIGQNFVAFIGLSVIHIGNALIVKIQGPPRVPCEMLEGKK